MAEQAPTFCGIINLDKPAGISSARAVGRVKYMLPRGTKIGHAGTLDPFATGVLLLLVGKATRLCESLMGQKKGYDAVVKLGANTPTDDPTSAEEAVEVAAIPDSAAVQAALAGMVGLVEQAPPVFSALKIDGKRAYKLARAGKAIDVEAKARPVMIYGMQLVAYEWPMATIRVECGRGTYIRSIARDLGKKLGTGGYLRELRRTFIGEFAAGDAVTLEQLGEDGVTRHLKTVGPADAKPDSDGL